MTKGFAESASKIQFLIYFSNILSTTGAKKSWFYLQTLIKIYKNQMGQYKYSGERLEFRVVLHIYIYTFDLQ